MAEIESRLTIIEGYVTTVFVGSRRSVGRQTPTQTEMTKMFTN